jgi:hypothetical protein
MAKKNRQPRKSKMDETLDLLKPINVLTLGSNDDPCFGKYHDLVSKECRSCGDSEFCAIALSQNLRVANLKPENKSKFKDIIEADNNLENKISEAKLLIEKYRSQGLPKTRILLKVWDELKLPKEEVKNLLNK